MFDTIYIEKAVSNHPRTRKVLERFPRANRVHCDRYTEIFNRKAQSFRLQKKKPALLLARRRDKFLLKTPPEYGIGAQYNFYFSHMLNCIYDCRYCFLQGMYRSAHYVLFVNYDDFVSAIQKEINSVQGQAVHFFSGYDCDSLAFEPVSGFTRHLLPLFNKNDNALLELRTKSTQIRSLLAVEPVPNCIVAFSLTPEEIAEALEYRVPSLKRRVSAMKRLQAHGWQIGLRFDPLIYQSDYRRIYASLFDYVFSHLDAAGIHSVSLGSFRLPKPFYTALARLYPDEKLFSSPLEEDNGMISYNRALREDLLEYCHRSLRRYIPEERFFTCDSLVRNSHQVAG